MWLADTDGRGESEHKTRTANQLDLMSPVAKKHSVDQPIRTESPECVAVWAKNDWSSLDFYTAKYRVMGKQRFNNTLRPRHLLTVVCGYYDIFPNRTEKKLSMFKTKLQTAALRLKVNLRSVLLTGINIT